MEVSPISSLAPSTDLTVFKNDSTFDALSVSSIDRGVYWGDETTGGIYSDPSYQSTPSMNFYGNGERGFCIPQHDAGCWPMRNIFGNMANGSFGAMQETFGSGWWKMQLKLQCGSPGVSYSKVKIECLYNHLTAAVLTDQASAPIQEPCPVPYLLAPPLVMNRSLPMNYGQTQSEGSVVQVNYGNIIKEENPQERISDFQILDSKLYAVNGGNRFASKPQLNYNTPLVENNTIKTFTYNGKEMTQLNWVKQLDENEDLCLRFKTDSQRDSFERALKDKQIGNTETFKLNTGSFGNSDYESEEKKYKSIDDWLIHSFGPNFGEDYKVYYDSYGKFDKVIIKKQDYTTLKTSSSGEEYYTAIKDESKDFLSSTYQTWNRFKTENPQFSGLSESYTGYSYLVTSGLSEDYTFGLYFNSSLFTGSTVIPFSDKFKEGSELLGSQTTSLAPAMLSPIYSGNSGPLGISCREPGNYMHYIPTESGQYRFQFKATLDVRLIDEGWCDYLNNYRVRTDRTFPSTDYHYKNLINLSVIKNGGNRIKERGEDLIPDIQTEGDFASKYTVPYGSVTPSYGYNSGHGVKDFNFKVQFKKKNTTTGDVTILTAYTISMSDDTYPNSNDYLELDILPTDKNTTDYVCTGGTSQIYHKTFDVSLDTGCVSLSASTEEIHLEYDAIWNIDSKYSGTSAYFKINLGGDEPYSATTETNSWYKVSKSNCDKKYSEAFLIWDSVSKSKPINYRSGGKNRSFIENGILYLDKDYSESQPPKVNLNTNNYSFLDLPHRDYRGGTLVFEPSDKQSNMWINYIERGTGDYIVSNFKERIVEIDGLKVNLNLPIQKKSQKGRGVFPGTTTNYLIKTRLARKGSNRNFTHETLIVPELVDDLYTNNVVKPLSQTSNIEKVESEERKESKLYFKDNKIIIDGKEIKINPINYDFNEPNKDVAGQLSSFVKGKGKLKRLENNDGCCMGRGGCASLTITRDKTTSVSYGCFNDVRDLGDGVYTLKTNNCCGRKYKY